jgi:hypothetical protein
MAPIVMSLTKIEMTDAAIEDFDLHIIRAGFMTVEGERRQGRGIVDGMATNLDYRGAPSFKD